jgi:transposase
MICPQPARLFASPYDVEARYTLKRATEWVGYKVHLTETCDADRPHLITQVTTTPAPSADSAVTTPIRASA